MYIRLKKNNSQRDIHERIFQIIREKVIILCNFILIFKNFKENIIVMGTLGINP